MIECFKHTGTVQSLYDRLIRSTKIGARRDACAFKRAVGIGLIFDDFVFPFRVSVVTPSSDAG